MSVYVNATMCEIAAMDFHFGFKKKTTKTNVRAIVIATAIKFERENFSRTSFKFILLSATKLDAIQFDRSNFTTMFFLYNTHNC